MILTESTMKYILTFILSFLSFLVCSQNITITDIPTIDQLPVNAIHRVFRDSEGYMWYGTVNGLCRDDGYHVKVFRSDIETPGLLEDNLVECIAEDKKGNIWFGTDKGVYILDKSDYSVHPMDRERLKNIPVMYLYATSDGYMWLSYRSILAKYDINGQLVKEYPLRFRIMNRTTSGWQPGGMVWCVLTLRLLKILCLYILKYRSMLPVRRMGSSLVWYRMINWGISG